MAGFWIAVAVLLLSQGQVSGRQNQGQQVAVAVPQVPSAITTLVRIIQGVTILVLFVLVLGSLAEFYVGCGRLRGVVRAAGPA